MIARFSMLCAVGFAVITAIERATVEEINPIMHPVAWVAAGTLLGAIVGAVLGGLYKIAFYRS